MNITYTPQRRLAAISVAQSGDTVTIDGELFDFGDMAEGDVYPKSELPDVFCADVRRVSGEIEVVLAQPVNNEGVPL